MSSFLFDYTKENYMENSNKKPVRILFLDIEGVLATHRAQFSKLERGALEDFDSVVVEFLDSICSKYLCYIVITSRKRKLFDSVDIFKSKMIGWGGGYLTDFLFPDDDLWRTTTKTLDYKSLEIDDWFEKFEKKFKNKFYIDNYVIIDDNLLGSISKHDDHFVYVKNGYNGMGCDEYRELIKILDKE